MKVCKLRGAVPGEFLALAILLELNLSPQKKTCQNRSINVLQNTLESQKLGAFLRESFFYFAW